MCEIIAVTPSGSIGKQVFAAGAASGSVAKKVRLRAVHLNTLSANMRVTIREGNASGNIILVANGFSAQFMHPIDLPEEGKRFDTGMHVKVIGTGAVAYLFIS